MMIQWNLTSKRTLIKDSDILVFSVAKSGRTWLRVLINKYLSLAYDIPFSLKDLGKHETKIPSILYTHEIWEHYSKATMFQQLLGKYIVTDTMLKSKKIVLLYRDPRDVLVSLFFHMRKRSEHKAEKQMSDLLFDKHHGIQQIVKVMNKWRERLKDHPNIFWIAYEELKTDTLGRLTALLEFLDFGVFDQEIARQAVAFAEFESMKKMEAKGTFGTKILKPGDPLDPDSFKVRKGKVGDYVNHFSNGDLILLDRAVADLDPFFAYDSVEGLS